MPRERTFDADGAIPREAIYFQNDGEMLEEGGLILHISDDSIDADEISDLSPEEELQEIKEKDLPRRAHIPKTIRQKTQDRFVNKQSLTKTALMARQHGYLIPNSVLAYALPDEVIVGGGLTSKKGPYQH